MNSKPFFQTLLAAVLGSSALHAADTLVDDFSGDLGAYTSTVILDANGGVSNISVWQITDETLELETTTYDGIEQYAYIRSGLSLAVGEELQADIAHSAASQDIGLYVGGTTPVGGTRQDYIAVYARGDGQVFSRGFDGLTEYELAGADSPVYDKLFIARTEENTYESGYYDGTTRNVIVTRTPATPNDGDVCGFYADVRATGTLGNADNLCIANIEPEYAIFIDESEFSTGETVDTTIGLLSATSGGAAETSTFALVNGDGDFDNDLFKIGGAGMDELQINADFTVSGEDPFTGDVYSVRVQGTDTGTGTLMVDLVIELIVFKDDDLDTLDDEWEDFWQGNLTDLDGKGGFDKDMDGLEDQEEYMLSLGTFAGLPAYDSDPDNSDTDGDMLSDGEETIDLVGDRTETNPLEADTDFDGLTDFEETNSFFTETLPMVGSDPTFMDSDGDGAKDGYEIERGTDPLDDTDYPASSSGNVTVTKITDDASTGISTAKNYTHAISGGYATTVNGVGFEVLDDVTTPAGFDWTTTPAGKNQIAAANLNDWIPDSGGVTGTGIIDLLSGFAFSDGAATPEGVQTYTLSGLTPGADYELRIYTRAWSPFSDSGRLIDLSFQNGAEAIQPWSSLAMDRPGFVLDSFNNDEAYFITYTYTAEGTDLVIDATIPRGADPGTVGFDGMHFYGLTNELLGGGLKITDVSLVGGDLKIAFSPGGAGFILTSSDDLASPFTEETNATYDNVSTFTVPAAFLDTDGDDFFRVESAP